MLNKRTAPVSEPLYNFTAISTRSGYCPKGGNALFTCKLDSASRTTLTDELYSALREEITSGRMAAGEKQPSKRQLAEHLHVSTATVEAAYGRLISEGYCESRPRSGIYAAKDLPQTGAAVHPRQVPFRWDFSTGAADAEHFPFSTWARLMRAVLR